MELAGHYLLFPEIEKDGSGPEIDVLRQTDAHGVAFGRRNGSQFGMCASNLDVWGGAKGVSAKL